MQYSDSLEKSTQHLRKALPLMSKFGVPITPPNYAVWYEYVTDENPVLKDKIDTALKKNSTFTDNLMSDLFNEHVVDINEEKLNRARHQLQSLMADVGDSIQTAGSSMEHYQQTLDSCSSELNQTSSTDSVLQVITTITNETTDIQRLNQELHDKLESAKQEAENLREDLQKARDQAFQDRLTGIANRHGFEHFLQNLMASEDFTRQPHAFLIADIDHFKVVNDTHGHLIGDKVIKFVANTMTGSTKGKDLVTRFGGEEFGIFLPNTSTENARTLAENIRTSIEKGKLIKAGTGEHIGQITISIGVAQLNANETIEQLIQRADEALYTAKQTGRNRVILAD